MDTNIPQNKISADASVSDNKNPAILNIPKKNNEPAEQQEISTETPNQTGIIQAKEFRIPKKPEHPKETVKTSGEDFSQKNPFDLSKKQLGWKTLTPTINIEAEIPLINNETGVSSGKNKRKITSAVSNNGALQKENLPKSNAEDISDLPTIRTYKKDVAGTIRGQKTSLVRMVLEEQKAQAKKELDESPQSRKNLPLILFSFVFFLLAVGIIYYAFFRTMSDNNTTFTELNTVPLIGTEYNKEIDTTNQKTKELSDSIKKEIANTNVRLDTLEYIYFTQRYTTSVNGKDVESKKITEINDIFNQLHISVPSNLLRSLKSDYLFGFHNFDGNQPFLILKTNYYSSTFAGMLEWEKTMLSDVFPLFGVIPTDELKNRTWIDMVVKNQNIRELLNFNNQIVLAYMFKNQDVLIISTNENTLFEVARRLDLMQEKK